MGSGRGQDDEGTAQFGDAAEADAAPRIRFPPNALEQAKAENSQGLIDEFVVRTLLNKEIAAKGCRQRKEDCGGAGRNEEPSARREDDGRSHESRIVAYRERYVKVGMNIKMDKLVYLGA